MAPLSVCSVLRPPTSDTTVASPRIAVSAVCQLFADDCTVFSELDTVVA